MPSAETTEGSQGTGEQMKTGTRGKKAAATRESLLNAALEVMSKKGYAEATVDEIAQEAGVSKGLAYYHFRSKGEIATEILNNGVSDMIARFHKVAESCSSGAEALKGMLNAFCDMIVGNWRFGKFYLSALWRDGRAWSAGMEEVDSRLIGIIAEQFARAQEEGAVRAGVDPEFCAVASIGLVLTASMRYFGMSETPNKLTREQFTVEVTDFVTNATAARP